MLQAPEVFELAMDSEESVWQQPQACGHLKQHWLGQRLASSSAARVRCKGCPGASRSAVSGREALMVVPIPRKPWPRLSPGILWTTGL